MRATLPIDNKNKKEQHWNVFGTLLEHDVSVWMSMRKGDDGK